MNTLFDEVRRILDTGKSRLTLSSGSAADWFGARGATQAATASRGWGVFDLFTDYKVEVFLLL